MIISSWLWWENLAVKYFLGLLISTENSIKAHRWEGTRWLPSCHFQLSSFGPETWLRTPLSPLIKQRKWQDLRHKVTLRIKGDFAHEELSTVSDTYWALSKRQPGMATHLANGATPRWKNMTPALSLKAGPPVLMRSCAESRALQTQGGVSITRSRRTSWKVVSTAARSWLCPQSRCGEMLPFFHIKFHINTNLFPVLAPVADPDFTLTESHLYHHLTQLHSSRNKKLIWLRAQFTVWQHKPGWFWLLTGAFGDLTMWGTSLVLSWQCGPRAHHSALCFWSPSVTAWLSVCCLPSWRYEAQRFLTSTAEQTG